MPLCNGVRPLHEDMPSRDRGGNIELYTSNTTAPILSILNHVTAEPEVLRDDLENSLMRNGVLSALGRKQLLNAVYGKEPDPTDLYDKRTGYTGKIADKDRFFRQHLGNKVLRGWAPGRRLKKGAGIHYENEGDSTAYAYADIEVEDESKNPMLGQAPAIAKELAPAWMGAELKRVGTFDPLSPDKRGKWKMIPLDGIELKTGHRPSSPHSPAAHTPGATARDSGGQKAALGEASKPMRIDQMISDLRIRSSHATPVIREVFRAVFEVATIQIHRFRFSLGELVGLAMYGQTFNIPHHTEHEQQCISALRNLCAKHLELLSKSNFKQDFEVFESFPGWKREYRALMERVMQSMPAWQAGAVHTFWNLNRKMMVLRDEADDTKHGAPKYFLSANATKEATGFGATALTMNEEYVRLQKEVVKHQLDLEWYDRLCLIHKRDRHYLREELVLYFENAILHKKSEAAHVEKGFVSTFHNLVAGSSERSLTAMTREEIQEGECCLLERPVAQAGHLRTEVTKDDASQVRASTAQMRTITRGAEVLLCDFPVAFRVLTPSTVQQQATAGRTPTVAAATVATGGNAKAAPIPSSLESRTIAAAPAAVLNERKAKPLEGITTAELVDMPQYWYDDRLASGDGGLTDKLSLKASKALKAMMLDTEEFNFQVRSKKKSDLVMTSKMLAYKLLNRKRGNMSSNNSLEYVQLVQKGGPGCQASGVVPGRIVDDERLQGASRGACSYRLVPSYPQHENQATHHPLSRPPSAKIKSMQQYFEIVMVLKKPAVDGRGRSLKLAAPVGFARPPTATPRSQRFRKMLHTARTTGTKTQNDTNLKAPPRPADSYDSDERETRTPESLSRSRELSSSPAHSQEQGSEGEGSERQAEQGSEGKMAGTARPASPSIHKIAATVI